MEIEDVIKVEKMEIEKSKDLLAKILILKDKSLNMVMLNFKNDKEKHFMRKKALELVKKMDADRYWFSSTAWFVSQDRDGKNLYKRPMRDVNRRECLIITEFRKDRKNKIYFTEIKRDMQDNATFLDDEKMNKLLNNAKSNSYWDAWEDEEKMDIENSKLINENNEKFIRNSVEVLMKNHKEELANIKSPEDFAKLMHTLVVEAGKKIQEENKTLLEDPEEFED